MHVDFQIGVNRMWDQIYQRVAGIKEDKGIFECLFRGHNDTNWKLLPGLGRIPNTSSLESILYFDYMTMAGALLPENASPWSIALSMQHHGLPTRLLDWTDNFAVSLFFALRNKSMGTPCIWILDPYKLNKLIGGDENLLSLADINGDYAELFINKSKSLNSKVIAVAPNRHHPRAFSQKSFFTIHAELEIPIEDLAPEAVEKIEIPDEALEGAQKFLMLAGVNEYSLFPDLDGLTRELRKTHIE